VRSMGIRKATKNQTTRPAGWVGRGGVSRPDSMR
jgi:hypothetical protein